MSSYNHATLASAWVWSIIIEVCFWCLSHFSCQIDEKRRLALVEEELQSMKYHPLRDQKPINGREVEFNIKRKKLKKCKGQSSAFGYFKSLSCWPLKPLFCSLNIKFCLLCIVKYSYAWLLDCICSIYQT